MNSGVSVLASVHCTDLKELLTKPQTRNLLDTGAFEYIVFLSDRRTPGIMKEIYTLEELQNYENDRMYFGNYKQHSHRLLSVSDAQTKNDVV